MATSRQPAAALPLHLAARIIPRPRVELGVPARIDAPRELSPEDYAVLVGILRRLVTLDQLNGAGLVTQYGLARDELAALVHRLGNGQRGRRTA